MIYAYFGKCELKYFGLFVADNDSTAIRVVEEELQKNKKLADYSMEYSLYSLCDYNEDTGFISNSEPHFIKDLSDILLDFIVRQRKQNELLSKVSGVPLEDNDTDSDISLDSLNSTI